MKLRIPNLYVDVVFQRHWAFSMSKILRAPFVDKLYWWTPVDLLRRLLFVILVVIFPGNPVSVYR